MIRLRRGIRFGLMIALVLWTVKAVEQASSVDLSFLGIYPRTLLGTIGIFTGPLVHGDVFHLISNTIPLLVLVIALFYFYRSIALRVFILVYLMTGIWVWFAAREAYHIGASGIVYGLISFFLFSGFLRRDPRSLALSFVIMVLYGGNMFYGVLPGQENISWESHLLGAIAGAFCAIYFKPGRTRGQTPESWSYRYPYYGSDLEKYHYKEESGKDVYRYRITDPTKAEEEL